jgi:hypothetical protein
MLRPARALNWSIDAPWLVPEHTPACNLAEDLNYDLSPEQLSMASDPKLSRFAEWIALLDEDRQLNTVPPGTDVCIFFPLQHLIYKVLHFVCELRESSIFP